jgi:hypothetical protein
MALEKREKEINGRQYSMLQASVLQVMPLVSRVTVLLGPVIPALVASAKGKSKESGLEKFGAVLQGVDPEKLHSVLMDSIAMGHLTCGNMAVYSDIDFERHFGEFRGDVYQVGLWVLWENVRDFFPILGTFVSKAMTAMETESESQTDGQ